MKGLSANATFPFVFCLEQGGLCTGQDRTGLEKDGRSQASESVGLGWVLSFLAPWLLSWSSGSLWINQKMKIAFVSLWGKEITCNQRLSASGW